MLALADEIDWDFQVATIDHGLRIEAADECALVEQECDRRDIPCTTLKVSVGRGNTQEEAREARYAALTDWARERGLMTILTAHHADDQAETLMMRLNRGSGLSGLAGIRSRRVLAETEPYVFLLRPLLGFRRAELRSLVERAGIPFVDDPSNEDQRFDRVRMRERLSQSDWLDVPALAQSAEHLGRAASTLDSIALSYWSQSVEQEGDAYLLPFTGWQEVNGRLIKRAIEAFGGSVTTGHAIEFVTKLVGEGAKGNIAGVLIERSGVQYRCTPEPPRRTG